MHERIVISFRNDATEWIQNQTGKELMENCMKPVAVLNFFERYDLLRLNLSATYSKDRLSA